MTNSEMDFASPFAAILAGQPTLNRQLPMGMFAALDQRIATRFVIKPMDLAESAAYLRHHLKLAGREIRCSPMTRSPGCTGWPTGCPARSTTPPSPRSSPPPPRQGPRRRRLRRKPSPSSPGTDHAPPGAPGLRPGAGPFL